MSVRAVRRFQFGSMKIRGGMDTKFNVKLEKEFGKYNLCVTHNGYQWSSIRIDEPAFEIPRIIKVLKDFKKLTQN